MKLAYRAYDQAGRLTNGVIESASAIEALANLRQQGLFPVEASPVGGQSGLWGILNMELGSGAAGPREKQGFCQGLSTLLQAGIPLDKSLALLGDSRHGRKISALSSHCYEAVTGGKSLSQALAGNAASFGPDEIGIVAAGEQTATLPQALHDLAVMLQNRIELQGRVTSALIYPAILLAMALLSLSVILTVLLPNLMPLISQSGQALPLPLRIAVAIKSFFTDNGLVALAGGLLSVLLFFLLLRSQVGKSLRHSITMRSRMARQISASRLLRTLATMINNGVALQSALKASAAALPHETLQSSMASAVEQVMGGARLAKALEAVPVLDPPQLQMIAIGEDANKLGPILLHLADALQQEATLRMERMLTLLTPLLTLLLGLLVGGLIMSVMRVILSVNDLVLQ